MLTKVHLVTPVQAGDTRLVIDEYCDAARAFSELVGCIQPAEWTNPALGEWSVRDLVGHAARSITLVGVYGSPEVFAGDPAEMLTAAGYYQVAMRSIGDPGAVAQRGRDAGAALGDNPAALIKTWVHDAEVLLHGGQLQFVASPVGPMQVDDYLQTRIVELVIHGDDLAIAIRRAQMTVSGPTRAAVWSVLGEIAYLRGLSTEVTQALMGRRDLPPGFNLFG
jgi:uncharacterized protein (TIGR03083 family)